MATFYTTIGDDGTTGLLRKGRVLKNDLIIDTIGTLDEANAALGIARAAAQEPMTKEMILAVQRDLYALMSEISAAPDHAKKFRKIDAERVSWLEAQIDHLTSKIQMPKEFIVPGDTYAGALVDLARSVVRRAERGVVTLFQEKLLDNAEILRYLNRLSSFCFVLELYENQHAGKSLPTLARDFS